MAGWHHQLNGHEFEQTLGHSEGRGGLELIPRPRQWSLRAPHDTTPTLRDAPAGEDSRIPWTARRSNQSILEEINPEYSLEGLMLKLKLSYFGHLMRRADSLEKTLMLGKMAGGEGDDRG